MIRCNKCNIEKEDNKFQIYWHSTHQKHHTRKQCTECYYNQRNERKRLKRKEAKLIQTSIPTEIVQPVVPELEPEIFIDYSLDENYKQCIKCKEYRTRDKFYTDGRDSRFNTCKICIKKKDDEEREEELIKNGGDLRISPIPNTYKDEYQKQLVFEFLPLCGWKFNEEAGIWWKPGFKNEDGTFVSIQNKRKRMKKLTKEQQLEIVRLRKLGFKLVQIADKFNVTKATICNVVRRYEEEKQYGTR